MAILMTFPDSLDSPTGQAEVRLRYGMHRRDGRTVPVLTYRHGMATELTREAWDGYQCAGARMQADSDREKSVLREVLGLDIS